MRYTLERALSAGSSGAISAVNSNRIAAIRPAGMSCATKEMACRWTRQRLHHLFGDGRTSPKAERVSAPCRPVVFGAVGWAGCTARARGMLQPHEQMNQVFGRRTAAEPHGKAVSFSPAPVEAR